MILIDTSVWILIFKDKSGTQAERVQTWLDGREAVLFQLISRESYKERKAVSGQTTLTGLGKWWRSKPLILIRASILGMLMPAGSNLQKQPTVNSVIFYTTRQDVPGTCNH